MDKDKIFRRQTLVFTAYNLVAFTIIFALFGLILYNQVSKSLYYKVDEELHFTMERITTFDLFRQDGPSPPLEQGGNADEMERPKDQKDGDKFFLTPNSMQIIWSADGAIAESFSGQVPQSYYDNFLQGLALDLDHLDEIVSFSTADGYHYRSITFAHSGHYVQLITNVDSGQAILNSFLRILLVCICSFVLLSIIISYLLSRRSMRPILRSWNRQVQFVQDASHELRTPLTIIQTKLEMLLRSPEKRVIDKSEDVALMLTETRRLSKLCNDLMTLARDESNASQLKKEALALDGLVMKICEPYMEMAEIAGKQFELATHFGGNIMADRNRIHQLMVTLLDNALKYTGEGDTIQVRTYGADGKVVIEVADTGIGIGDEALPRVFERFFREDKARSRASGGSGLGLSIAQWIVHKHDGSIKACHNQPKGAIFRVRLPSVKK